MEYLTKTSYDVLLKRKETLKKKMERQGNSYLWNRVKVDEIYLDRDGDLATNECMTEVKLKDLVYKDSDEKILKDEFQTDEQFLSERNLRNIRGIVAAFKQFQFEYDEVCRELYRRDYGHYPEQLIIPPWKRDYVKLNQNDIEKKLSEKFQLITSVDIMNHEKCVPKRTIFRMDNETYELTVNKLFDDIFNAAFSIDELLTSNSNIQRPETIKSYLNVDLMENYGTPEQRKYFEVKKEAEENDYFFFVDKYSHEDENIVDYHLYNKQEYYCYQESLKQAFLNLCKQSNDEEYQRLHVRIGEINNDIKKHPYTEDYKKIHAYLGKVCLQIGNWYKEKKFNSPEINSITKSNKTKRIKQKDRIEELAIESNLTQGETVDSIVVNKILRTLQKEKLTKSNKPETVRKQLQRLGYSREVMP